MEISNEEMEILRGCCYKPQPCCKHDCCQQNDCCKKTDCCQVCCPQPEPEEDDRFYAQYAVRIPNPASSSNLSFLNVFNIGNRISLYNEQTIILPQGWLYQISYVFLASPGYNSHFEILPYINEQPGLNYAFFAPTNSVDRNTSASATFLTNLAVEQEARLNLRVAYDRTTNLDISGVVSIVPYRV